MTFYNLLEKCKHKINLFRPKTKIKLLFLLRRTNIKLTSKKQIIYFFFFFPLKNIIIKNEEFTYSTKLYLYRTFFNSYKNVKSICP